MTINIFHVSRGKMRKVPDFSGVRIYTLSRGFKVTTDNSCAYITFKQKLVSGLETRAHILSVCQNLKPGKIRYQKELSFSWF
jgi:hypothetical protein